MNFAKSGLPKAPLFFSLTIPPLPPGIRRETRPGGNPQASGGGPGRRQVGRWLRAAHAARQEEAGEAVSGARAEEAEVRPGAPVHRAGQRRRVLGERRPPVALQRPGGRQRADQRLDRQSQ